MADPEEDIRTLIDYARRKFAAERWPLSPSLRPVRQILSRGLDDQICEDARR